MPSSFHLNQSRNFSQHEVGRKEPTEEDETLWPADAKTAGIKI